MFKINFEENVITLNKTAARLTTRPQNPKGDKVAATISDILSSKSKKDAWKSVVSVVFMELKRWNRNDYEQLLSELLEDVLMSSGIRKTAGTYHSGKPGNLHSTRFAADMHQLLQGASEVIRGLIEKAQQMSLMDEKLFLQDVYVRCKEVCDRDVKNSLETAKQREDILDIINNALPGFQVSAGLKAFPKDGRPRSSNPRDLRLSSANKETTEVEVADE